MADGVTADRIAADWIAADWGTTNLRAWAMGPAGEVVASAAADTGAGGLAAGAFEGALLDAVGAWLAPDLTTPVLICGMAGARTGWREAPYVDISAGLDGVTRGAVSVETASPLVDVCILPGLCQRDPPDVIRGEETQLLGLLADDPDFDGLVIMPGTHSKWLRIASGRPVSTMTAMTGELYDLLRRLSILRHSVGGEGFDDAAFAEAVAFAHAAPEAVLPALFQLRAADMLDEGAGPAAGAARLSGLLVGLELRSALPAGELPRVAIVGAEVLVARYAAALATLGIAAEPHDGSALALAGLRIAHAAMAR
jgi:2-dehydro-3-deoxygalactonokinase